jgi:hypothetical protein
MYKEQSMKLHQEQINDNNFNISADFICIAGFDGYFKRINPAVSKLLGFTEDELYSRPLVVLYTHLTSKLRN